MPRFIILMAGAFVLLPMLFGCSSDEKSTTGPDQNIITRTVRDIDFERRTIFDLGRLPLMRAKGDTLPEPDKYDFAPGDSIVKLIAFLDDRTPSDSIRMLRPQAMMYIDANDTLSDDSTCEYKTLAFVDMINSEDYYLQPTSYYLQFLQPVVGFDHIFGVYMEVQRAGGVIDTIGDISSQPYCLKLIKPAFHVATNHHVWEYEWRNVYSLGDTTNINPADLNVMILKGTPTALDMPNPDDLNHQQGVGYIQILGLDRGDNSGQGEPDNEIDRYVFVDPMLGLLFFPTRHPFDSWLGFATDPEGNFVFLADPVPEMYQYGCPSNMGHCQTYYLSINYVEP